MKGTLCVAQACFLTRGDLYVSWERGRDTFDKLLIDGDPSINSANWFAPVLLKLRASYSVHVMLVKTMEAAL